MDTNLTANNIIIFGAKKSILDTGGDSGISSITFMKHVNLADLMQSMIE